MTREEAIEKYVIPAIERTWNEKNCKKILEALEQEHCEDAISREDALMALTGEWTESRDEILSKAIRRIQKLSSVNPKSDWIPCRDRLPEEYGEYMFTWVTSCVPNKRFIGVAEYEITNEWDVINGRWNGKWLFEDYMKVYPDVKVLAWMPLPEPYKEVQND